MAVGGEEESWDVGNGLGEEEEKEIAFFQGCTKYKG